MLCAALATASPAATASAQEAKNDLAAEIRAAAADIGGHPRILITPDLAAGLADHARGDARRARIADATIRSAEALVDEPVLTREVEGRRMLRVSRQALNRITTLSTAWKLTGEARFADRAAAELRAVSAFENWNPSHFLDTAEMAFAVAIGYDWLHDRLDQETREAARRAIVEKALAPALSSDRHWWKRTTNNWNQVCHGGLLAGAFAVIDHHPGEALRVIEMAVRNVPAAMASYSPHGAYPEGPGYWSYGTNYNVVLLDLLRRNLGGTFGLDGIEGFSETGAFPMLMTAPSGLPFNFSDNRAARRTHPAVYWLAARYDRPEWTRAQDRAADALPGGADDAPAPSWPDILGTLVWRDPGDLAHDGEADEADGHGLPLHWFSHGEVPVSVHRESWDCPDAVFVGVKAGSAAVSHGQMDIGSFVMEADGVRWAHDLGPENYHQVESRGLSLWDESQDGDRWSVFRNNNHSHGTLIIDGQLQHAAGRSPMVRFSADPAFPHSVIDMSPSYRGQLDTAYRGIGMLPSGSVLVRDQLGGLRPGAEVRWAMVTRAEPGETGKPTLELRQAGKSLTLTVHGDHEVAWETTDLATPPNEWDSPNEGFTRVSFTTTAPESGALDLAVVLRPGSSGDPDPGSEHLAPPIEWSPDEP